MYFCSHTCVLNHIDCKAGTTAKGQIYWPIFQLAELVFFRASTYTRKITAPKFEFR